MGGTLKNCVRRVVGKDEIFNLGAWGRHEVTLGKHGKKVRGLTM